MIATRADDELEHVTDYIREHGGDLPEIRDWSWPSFPAETHGDSDILDAR